MHFKVKCKKNILICLDNCTSKKDLEHILSDGKVLRMRWIFSFEYPSYVHLKVNNNVCFLSTIYPEL